MESQNDLLDNQEKLIFRHWLARNGVIDCREVLGWTELTTESGEQDQGSTQQAHDESDGG